jgi:hypothetical protein
MNSGGAERAGGRIFSKNEGWKGKKGLLNGKAEQQSRTAYLSSFSAASSASRGS